DVAHGEGPGRRLGEQAHESVDVIGVDVREHDELDATVARRHRRDLRLERAPGADRAAVDQHASDAPAGAVFDPQAVAMQRREHADAKERAVARTGRRHRLHSLQSASPKATMHSAIGRLSSSASRRASRISSPSWSASSPPARSRRARIFVPTVTACSPKTVAVVEITAAAPAWRKYRMWFENGSAVPATSQPSRNTSGGAAPSGRT